MGTSSAIGRLVNSNSVQFVMCNYDGYLDGVGKELIAEYNSPSAVIELISGGEIRSIIPQLEYYEDGEPADACSLSEYENGIGFVSYAYLYKDGQWYYIRPYKDGEWKSVKEALFG